MASAEIDSVCISSESKSSLLLRRFTTARHSPYSLCKPETTLNRKEKIVYDRQYDIITQGPASDGQLKRPIRWSGLFYGSSRPYHSSSNWMAAASSKYTRFVHSSVHSEGLEDSSSTEPVSRPICKSNNVN